MEMKTPQNYQHHFVAEETNVSGREFETTVFLENISASVGERLIALHFALRMFDSISCESDREKVKYIVKAQIDWSAELINYDRDRVAGMLPFVKIPSTARMGLRMKDDMREVKEKLDAIAAALD